MEGLSLEAAPNLLKRLLISCDNGDFVEMLKTLQEGADPNGAAMFVQNALDRETIAVARGEEVL
jgi:hypothetical protein